MSAQFYEIHLLWLAFYCTYLLCLNGFSLFKTIAVCPILWFFLYILLLVTRCKQQRLVLLQNVDCLVPWIPFILNIALPSAVSINFKQFCVTFPNIICDFQYCILNFSYHRGQAHFALLLIYQITSNLTTVLNYLKIKLFW